MLARHRLAYLGAGIALLAATALLALLSGSPQPVRAVGPIVTSNNDINDGACDLQHCSLREALIDVGTGETVTFAIDGVGPHVIQVGVELPPIVEDGVTVNGYSQTGALPNTAGAWQPGNASLQIVLDGSQAVGGNQRGFWIDGLNVTIRGIVIQNFSGDGIHVGTVASAAIKGNYIGTSATGTAAAGNGGAGIHLVSNQPGNAVGSNQAADRNIISGNGNDGVQMDGVAKLAVYGNFIGTDATGTLAIPNGGGVAIHTGPESEIGAPTNGAGNLISGNNGDGITISGVSNQKILVRSNRIGTKADGQSALPNQGNGIFLSQGAFANTIGAVAVPNWNTIAFNRDDGIAFSASAGIDNYLDPNLIHDNGGLGIDLLQDGVTANDQDDADEGPNDLQNYPVITRAEVVNGLLEIEGTLHSDPAASFYPLFFFANSECDPSGYGEGERYVTEDFASGSGPDYVFSGAFNVPVYDGEVLTALSSNPESSSEFSACFAIEGAPPPTPTPSPSPTASGSPTPTGTATPASSPTASAEPTDSGTPTPTSTPTPFGQTPSPTLAATPTATPTLTPAGIEREWGDGDCTGGTNPVDSLKTLRVDAGLEVIQPDFCPEFGDHVTIDGEMYEWGDIDCNFSLNPVDSLKILRFDAGLDVQQPSGCPDLGETVLIT